MGHAVSAQIVGARASGAESLDRQVELDRSARRRANERDEELRAATEDDLAGASPQDLEPQCGGPAAGVARRIVGGQHDAMKAERLPQLGPHAKSPRPSRQRWAMSRKRASADASDLPGKPPEKSAMHGTPSWWAAAMS